MGGTAGKALAVEEVGGDYAPTRPLVVEDQHIQGGQLLGYIGSSGNSSGSYPHCEVHTGTHATSENAIGPVTFMIAAGQHWASGVWSSGGAAGKGFAKPGSAVSIMGFMENLRGEHVVLRRAISADAPAFRAMLNTPEVHRWWEWSNMESELGKEDDKHNKLAIMAGTDLVGMISWYEQKSEAVRYAGMDLFLDPAFHRRGYGTDAVGTLARWLLGPVGHHRLVIDPHVDNTAAIACYRKAGFKDVGVMRQYITVHGGPWRDALLMDLLITDLP